MNLQTFGPEQHCRSPQTPQQFALSAGRVQAELVCVTGLPDSFCFLHPDTNRGKSFNNTSKKYWQKIILLTSKKKTKKRPFGYLLDTRLKNETESKWLLSVLYNYYLDAVFRAALVNPLPAKTSPVSHHQMCVRSVRQRVHQARACLRQIRQRLAPVGSLGEETLLHALFLSLDLLQETLLLLLQGFTCSAHLSQHLLPRPARRCLHNETGGKGRNTRALGVYEVTFSPSECTVTDVW